MRLAQLALGQPGNLLGLPGQGHGRLDRSHQFHHLPVRHVAGLVESLHDAVHRVDRVCQF